MFIAGRRMELKAKGVEQLVAVFEVLGIDGSYNLHLPKSDDALAVLGAPVPLNYSMVEGASLASETQKGSVTKLSLKEAEARLEAPVPLLTNLQMRLIDIDGAEVPGVLYGKVIEITPGSSVDVRLRFTSTPPSVMAFLRDLLARAA